MKKGFLFYVITFLILTIPLTLFLHLYYSYTTGSFSFSFSFWNIKLLLCFELSVISLGLVWLLYSKIVSRLLNTSFKETLKKDLFTYSPFILLLFYDLPLHSYTSGWFSSYRLLLVTILLIIILKVATILQIKKKLLGAHVLIALVVILPLLTINYFLIKLYGIKKQSVKPNFLEILKHKYNADPSSFFSGNLTGIEKKKIRINDEIRNSLVLLPPQRVETTVTIPAKTFLQFGFGVWEETYSGLGDGVRLNLLVRNKNKIKKIYSKYIDPKHNEKDRRWFDVEIDLKDYAKQKVSIIFEASGSPEINPIFKRKADNRDDYLVISDPSIRSKFEKDTTDYNIILISIDTLRADHLGCYGYRRKDISPHIDRMADNGILFKNAISQSSWTIPSHMSIFTSLLPSSHGVNGSSMEFVMSVKNQRMVFRTLPEDATTITECFRSNRYSTVAFTGGGCVGVDMGFGQGFDRFFEETREAFASKSGFNELTEWLEINKKRTFFLFLHTFRVHSPYKHLTYAPELLAKSDIAQLEKHIEKIPPDSYDLKFRFKDRLKTLKLWKKEVTEILYEGGITETDKYIGKLMDELKRLNLLNKTIIVLTSDHGEEFGEHNKEEIYCGHGKTLYDEVIRVPLIFVVPGNFPKGKRIDYQVRLIDIMPTLLDLARIKSDSVKDLQGVSLLPILKGETPETDELVAISEVNVGIGKNYRDLKSIRTNNFKYIYTGYREKTTAEKKLFYDKPVNQELYDLINDSVEKFNVCSYEPELSKSSKIAIMNTLKDAVKKSSNVKEERRHMIDKNTTKRIKALGYIQ